VRSISLRILRFGSTLHPKDFAGDIDRSRITNLKKNSKNSLLSIFQRSFLGQKWTKVEHKFHDYGPGVRYVYVRSDGRSLLGWPGPYGVKMANISIVVSYK
jgi:hypothetical protein